MTISREASREDDAADGESISAPSAASLSDPANLTHRAHIEPLLGTASREVLVQLVLAGADAVDRQQAQIAELMTALNLAAKCGQRTVESEKRIFKAIETAAKVLTAAVKMKKLGQGKAAAEAIDDVRTSLNEIVAAGTTAIDWPEIELSKTGAFVEPVQG